MDLEAIELEQFIAEPYEPLTVEALNRMFERASTMPSEYRGRIQLLVVNSDHLMQALKDCQSRVEALELRATELLAHNPFIVYTGGGDETCIACYHSENEGHDGRCAWVLLQEALLATSTNGDRGGEAK